MHFTISSLFVLATAAVATADGGFLNPPLDSIKPIPISSPAGTVRPIVGRMTNARRLAMGLPPLKPKTLWRGTPAASAPRSNTSILPPVPHTCNILVKNEDDGGSVLGYLSPTWNSYGEYGASQQSQANSLEVTFYASPDDPSPKELDLFANNSPDSSYPYLGGVVGFSSDSSDFGAGSFSYAYIVGTKQTPAGSPPQSADSSYRQASGFDDGSESAIWKYNPMTKEVTAQWINTDGSRAAAYIFIIDNVLILTGDVNVGPALGDSSRVTFTCVEPVAQQPGRE